MARNKFYDSESGEVMEVGQEPQGVVPVEPLRVPGAVEQIFNSYVPAVDERSADEVLTLGYLRDLLCAWMPFGSKQDPLQDYLDALVNEGYIIQNTSSGPALCVMRRQSLVDITPFQEIDEL